MSGSAMNSFFEVFESTYPGLKRAKNKPYAMMQLKPASEIFLTVKKSSIKVEFGSNGSEKALSTDALKSWAEESGILGKEIAGKSFELAVGARNRDKLSVVVEIPLADTEQLLDQKVQDLVKGALDIIFDNLGEVASPTAKEATKKDPTKTVSLSDIENEVSRQLESTLEDIIDSAEEQILENESFLVRPGFGPEKFYLDRVDGAYECSLQNLIHHILWQRSLYETFLNARQLAVAKAIVEGEPDGIYRPDSYEAKSAEEEAEEEATRDLLDSIYDSLLLTVRTSLNRQVLKILMKTKILMTKIVAGKTPRQNISTLCELAWRMLMSWRVTSLSTNAPRLRWQLEMSLRMPILEQTRTS